MFCYWIILDSMIICISSIKRILLTMIGLLLTLTLTLSNVQKISVMCTSSNVWDMKCKIHTLVLLKYWYWWMGSWLLEKWSQVIFRFFYGACFGNRLSSLCCVVALFVFVLSLVPNVLSLVPNVLSLVPNVVLLLCLSSFYLLYPMFYLLCPMLCCYFVFLCSERGVVEIEQRKTK
jgi:hypothetical protein